MLRLFVSSVLLASLFLTQPVTAASESAPVPSHGHRISLETFGMKLLGTLTREKDQNILVSPLSLSVALIMAAQGATRPARDAMVQILGFSDMSVSEVAEWLAAALDRIAASASDTAITVESANGLWVDDALDLYPAFADALRLRFGADVEVLDFGDPETVGRLNAWVVDKTNGTIDHLVRELSKETALVLANALYFEGKWTHPFDPEVTKPGAFNRAVGDQVEIPFMHSDGVSFRYREDQHAQAVELPYGDGAFRLVILLPKGELDVGTAIERMLETRQSWLLGTGFTPIKGKLGLPRFEMEFGVTITPALRQMGLAPALDDPSSFSGIAGAAPSLDRVIHKTALKIDEQGTEAAAVSAVTLQRSFVEQENFEMVVDRPFFLALRHVETGALLFVGRVADPSLPGSQ